jgi:hypothetical protein
MNNKNNIETADTNGAFIHTVPDSMLSALWRWVIGPLQHVCVCVCVCVCVRERERERERERGLEDGGVILI